MTWKQLKILIDRLPPKELNKQIPVFNFSDGFMVESLNHLVQVGQYKQLDSHNADIESGQYKDGRYYLVSELREPIKNFK